VRQSRKAFQIAQVAKEEEEEEERRRRRRHARGSMLRLSFLLLQPLRVALRLGSAQECAFSLVWDIDYMTKKGAEQR
jgi:hypothetical protein